MKLGSKLFIPAAFVAFALSSTALKADMLNFSYSFPLNGLADGVTGMGVLTTTPLVNNQYTIIGITGSRTTNGVTDEIDTLLAPGAFGGNDNLLFATGPFLDGNGVSFLLATGGGDNGMGDVNIFYDASLNAYGYTEASSQVGFGTFTVSNGAIFVPEPVPPTFAVIALFGAVGWWRRKRSA